MRRLSALIMHILALPARKHTHTHTHTLSLSLFSFIRAIALSQPCVIRRGLCEQEAEAAGLDYERLKARKVTALQAESKDRKKKRKNEDPGFSDFAAASHRQCVQDHPWHFQDKR